MSKKNVNIGNRIGDCLIRKGCVTRETVEKALRKQASEPPGIRRKLGDILISDFKVDRHIVYREIAGMYAFQEIDLSNGALNDSDIILIQNMIKSLDQYQRTDARINGIIPYKINSDDRKLIYIAAADPTHPEIPRIAKALGFTRYEVQYCNFDIIQDLFKKALPSTNEYLQDFENTVLEEHGMQDPDEDIDELELDSEINKGQLTNLIEGCFMEAVRKGVSDVHFIPKTGTSVEIFFRINGKLFLWHTQSSTKAEAIAAVLKDRSKNVNRFNRDLAQDGFFQREIDGKIIRFRVSILPIVGVEYERKLESIVVRILDDTKVITDLNKLGFLTRAREDFRKAIDKPQGIIILTGPTGSGKSTTLVAALNTIMTPQVNVLTVEEPVEYLIPGARQLKISPTMDFEMALRSILRHDPDIVMVGEVRDWITAEIAFKLANTGHLTFSTLHTNDAASVISRLYKIGIEPFLIAYAVNIVVAQRLVRKLCSKCKEIDTEIDPMIPGSLGFSEEETRNIQFYKPVGCDRCHEGYSGRVAIHEALFFTKEIRKAILKMSENIDEERIKQLALDNGMLTLRASGRERVKAGESTCAEVAFVTAED
ncbi:MAG: type II/IV secretion system protein [bacterium]|nr:type II/IV secretion system protein [bacterium]